MVKINIWNIWNMKISKTISDLNHGEDKHLEHISKTISDLNHGEDKHLEHIEPWWNMKINIWNI